MGLFQVGKEVVGKGIQAQGTAWKMAWRYD
jgi:hypothetical protein